MPPAILYSWQKNGGKTYVAQVPFQIVRNVYDTYRNSDGPSYRSVTLKTRHRFAGTGRFISFQVTPSKMDLRRWNRNDIHDH